MQAAFRGVRVHRAGGAVFRKDGGQALGVVGEVLQRHGAVLDEGDRLALLFHRHHHVEPGGAEFGYAGLQRRLRDLDHAAPFALRVVPGKAEVAHQLAELLELRDVVAGIFFGEFDDQHRFGIAAHRGADDRLEHIDVAAERQHGAVD